MRAVTYNNPLPFKKKLGGYYGTNLSILRQQYDL